MTTTDALPEHEERERARRVDVLRRLSLATVPIELVQYGFARSDLLRAVFAVGIARLGGNVEPIVTSITSRLADHEPVVRTLLRLYLDRALVLDDDDDRRALLQQHLLEGLGYDAREPVEWLVQRSSLLFRPETGDGALVGFTRRPAPGISSVVTRVLNRVNAEIARAPEAMAEIVVLRDDFVIFDEELMVAVERLLAMSRAKGTPGIVRDVLAACVGAVDEIGIVAHRMRALASCLHAASLIDDDAVVAECVAALVKASPSAPPGDVLLAVEPALRLVERCPANWQALVEVLQQRANVESAHHARLLRTAAARINALQGEADVALAVLDTTLDVLLGDPARVGHVERYEAGAAVVAALACVPLDAAALRYERMLRLLNAFTDTFTVYVHYRTHELLIAEHIVDAVSSVSTR